MKRCGLTLIEMSVACLITALLLHSAFNLLYGTLKSFKSQESFVTSTWQTNLVISNLLQDFEESSFSIEDDYLNQVKAFFESGESNLVIPMGKDKVEYRFNNNDKALTRKSPKRESQIAKKLLSRFTCKPFLQTLDGSVAASFVLPEKSKISRIWFNIEFEMLNTNKAGEEKNRIYKFNIFPVQLNRQIQSIWILSK